MKPVTVLTPGPPASRARRGAGPQEELDDRPEEDEAPRGVMPVVWAAVAVLLVVGVVVGLFVRGDADRPDDDPTDPPSPTPTLLVLDQPTVRAERVAEGVRFTWSVPGDPVAGDSWQLHLVDREEYRTTRRRSLLLRTPERTCLRVTLERDGLSSPPGQECG